MTSVNERTSALGAILATTIVIGACSALPEDFRAALPEAMRGDTRALSDYPTPNLSGNWQDTDYPELTIDMQQSGERFTMTRKGDYRGIPVDETYQGTMDGRSIKATFQALDKGKLRPIKGRCFGVASQDSDSLQLTCTNSAKGTVPLNLNKS